MPTLPERSTPDTAVHFRTLAHSFRSACIGSAAAFRHQAGQGQRDSGAAGTRLGPDVLEQYERAAGLAADARILAGRLRAACLEEPLRSLRGKSAKLFKALVVLLELFGIGIRDLTDKQGGPGHMVKTCRTKLLMAA